MNKNLIFAIFCISLIFILIACSSNKKEGSFTGFALSNPIKTCRNVEVPYQITEEYQVPLKYEIISAEQDGTSSNFNYFTTLTVKVRNVDSETGLFQVKMSFKTLNDQQTKEQVSHYIMPGEIKEFYQTYDSDLGEDVKSEYVIVPGQKTLTRTVTKYKTEQRCD